MNRESLAARLRAAFQEDLDEQLRAMGDDLLALERSPSDAGRLGSVFRAAHTLKGAARAASLPAVERLCHVLEERLSGTRGGRSELGPADFAHLFAASDALARVGESLRAGDEPGAAALLDLAHAIESGEPPPSPASAAAASPPAEPSAPSDGGTGGAVSGPGAPWPSSGARAESPSETRTAIGAPPARGSAESTQAETAPGRVPAEGGGEARGAGERGGPGAAPVRVAAEKLDALLSASGQLLLARGRVAQRVPEAEELREEAARAETRWRRAARALRTALEGAGADRTALDAVAAAEESLRTLARDAGRLADGLRGDVRALSQAAGDVGEHARSARMRPFAEACEGLARTVRDLASASGKEVRVALSGGEVEADRAVLDGVREALIHLVRNAVDHGMEPPAAREATGKPPAGTISVSAALRGDRLVVTVADDGRGIDEAAVRARLAREGRAVPTGRGELAAALFEGGFSTRDRADEVSGRGVGLDAARAAAARVRGTLEVEWEEGRGTVFTLEAPLTLATIRALLVSVGVQALAIPTAAVERIERVDPAALRRAEGREVVPAPGGPVAVAPLARILGPPLAEVPVSAAFPAVLLRAGGLRLLAAVDGLLGEQELVVRPLERGGRALPHLSGAAILPSGVVVLVLDPASVVATGLGAASGEGVRVAPVQRAALAARRVLVVDDSITTRTLEQGTLEAAGYEVATAVDGADAWRILQERGADLVVSDVEMPRMDGFALCEAIRASRRFAELPVVLVTSLERPEHRERGLEAGADAYIGKSGFDQQALLETVRRLLG